MFLPQHVLECLGALEQAGFSTYAVGGCVRDSLLGLTPHDYDLCTDALPEQIKTVFSHHTLVLSGEKHGTVGVVADKNVIEITTFRTEGDYSDNRHPGWVQFVPRLEEDLARRDFTVNAMAYSPARGLADPFGGQEDLKNRILRAVGDPYARFREDSLRILRGARFAVRYRLTPEQETEKAMNTLAPLMDNLSKERVFEELCKLLLLADADDLQRYAKVLTQVLPELKPMLGFDQRSRHHAFDLYTHTARAVSLVPGELSLRWAALLHDIGKPATFTLDEDGHGHFYGHAAVSAQMADAALRRLKAPNQLRDRVVFLIEKHMAMPEADTKFLRRWLSRFGQAPLQQLLVLQRADTLATGVHTDVSVFDRSEQIAAQLLEEASCLQIRDLAVNGQDLLALGIPAGPQIGSTLAQLLDMVLDERIPNERNALLTYLQKTE